MNNRNIKLIIVVLVGLFALTGCGKRVMFAETNFPEHTKASYKLFSDTESKRIKADKGEIIHLEYASEVEKGSLSILLYDPDGNLIADLETNAEGMKDVTASESGKYKLNITGVDAKGSFNIKWKVK